MTKKDPQLTAIRTPKHLTLLPAYGRDYTSKEAAIKDFEANKDFKESVSRCYINKPDIGPGTVVNIRYNRLTEICQITKE